MSLSLIHGPPNSGRAALIRQRFAAALDRDPILVVPNMDDVFSFERELCQAESILGGSVMTFGALFRAIAIGGGAPPGPELTPVQRLQAVAVAVRERRELLGPLRQSTDHPGFARALESLLGELQAAGLDPRSIGAEAETLESSAYLGDLATICEGYADVRSRLGRTDQHVVAREAIALVRESPEPWRGRPLFLYGLDDLTGNQLDLIEALSAITEVTVALPYEEGRTVLAARAGLLDRLRSRIGIAEETQTEPNPEHTDNPLLFHLERHFSVLGAEPEPPGEGLTLLRSAGARGEAEAIATEVAKLVSGGADPKEIAVVLRDPARRGPTIASVLESYGIATALEAELPVAGTAVGGGLAALLETEFGAGRAADLLRFLRGPAGASPDRVDWLERAVRRGRVQSAAEALELWGRDSEEIPPDLSRVRQAAADSRSALAKEVGRLAATMASRPLHNLGDGALPGPGEAVELRAAAAISNAFSELAELGELAPEPERLAEVLEGIEFRVWSGPVEGRVRIASPYRMRAGRLDHVFVASLQEGEFPRRDPGGDPFLSDSQRESLGLDPRRDTEAEENYLFYVSLSLPRRSLYLSYRDSDEDGVAEPRSPLLDEVVSLLTPPPGTEGAATGEEAVIRGRDLAQVAHPVAEAPSEDELARAIAAHGESGDSAALLAAAEVAEEISERVSGRIASARTAEMATRKPGPISNPAVLDSLASVPAYGGTTLEGFDLCSFRWFVGHELDPQPLDSMPEPIVQGGLMHAALERLYGERPGGDPLPRPGSLNAWIERAGKLVSEIATEMKLGKHPTARAIVHRIERLLIRYLTEEAERDTGGFEPWLLEATFGEEDDSERPVLEIGDWGLHGAIDRVDRDSRGHAIVIDYKVSPGVTSRDKFEERAKLQLQLYMLAVAEHWGGEPVGGLYFPLRGTRTRRPRGAMLEEAATVLASYGLYENDLVDREGLRDLLEEARRRADAIVRRMRAGDIRRDPGPRPGLKGHDTCPPFCEFAPICRRDRGPAAKGASVEDSDR